MEQPEEWKEIPSIPGYEASSLGRIRSVDRVITYKNGRRRFWPGMIMGQSVTRHGYLRIVGRRQGLVHKYVLEAFRGPKPTPTHQCAHNDGNRQNNKIENLRWATPRENNADKKLHGTQQDMRGENAPAAWMTKEFVFWILDTVRAGKSQHQLARETGIHVGYINLLVRGKRWSHLPY